MNHNYYHDITDGPPNYNVVSVAQEHPQQLALIYPNLSAQFQLWEPEPTYLTLIPQQEVHVQKISYEEMMQKTTAVLSMIQDHNISISEIMYALEEMTKILKGNVKELGLHMDNPNTLQQHRSLWKNFNYCWLHAFQRYIENPADDFGEYKMEEIGNVIVKFADYVEPYGLVDYEMGIWEEEILDLIGRCMDEWQKMQASLADSNCFSNTK